MREIIVKVYKFEELSEEGQQAALSNLRDLNVDYDWWDYDGLLDLTQEEMDEVEIKPDEIEDVLISYNIEFFDIDRGQYIQFKDVVVNNEDAFRRFLKIPEALWKQCDYYFNNSSGNRSTYLKIIVDYIGHLTDEEISAIDNAANIMADKIHEAWVSLRNSYEYLTSDESIKETIEANEYEFYENGKLI